MANNYGSRQTPRCSFCGKEQRMVNRLVAGPNVYICNECIALCNEILNDESFQDQGDARESIGPVKLPLPSEMTTSKPSTGLAVISMNIGPSSFCCQVPSSSPFAVSLSSGLTSVNA